jgi:hypothetical protein
LAVKTVKHSFNAEILHVQQHLTHCRVRRLLDDHSLVGKSLSICSNGGEIVIYPAVLMTMIVTMMMLMCMWMFVIVMMVVVMNSFHIITVTLS